VLFLGSFPGNWLEKLKEGKRSRQDNERNSNNFIPTFTLRGRLRRHKTLAPIHEIFEGWLGSWRNSLQKGVSVLFLALPKAEFA
jgi:hypothetical protein